MPDLKKLICTEIESLSKCPTGTELRIKLDETGYIGHFEISIECNEGLIVAFANHFEPGQGATFADRPFEHYGRFEAKTAGALAEQVVQKMPSLSTYRAVAMLSYKSFASFKHPEPGLQLGARARMGGGDAFVRESVADMVNRAFAVMHKFAGVTYFYLSFWNNGHASCSVRVNNGHFSIKIDDLMSSPWKTKKTSAVDERDVSEIISRYFARRHAGCPQLRVDRFVFNRTL